MRSDRAPEASAPDAAGRLRRWSVTTYLVVALAILLVAGLGLAAIQLEDAVVSYVRGESLWSKAQKEAVMALEDYARTGDRAAWDAYREALRIPLGDRRAREALQADPPDLEAARRGFRQGGLEPGEIDGMIRLFRWFGHREPMARTIEHWTAGDSLVAELEAEARRIRDAWRSPPPDSAALERSLARVRSLDRALAERERRFSVSLDRAADVAQRWSERIIAALVVLLLVAGAFLTRRVYRLIRDREASLRRSERRYRHLFEHNVAGVFRSTLDGTLLACNPAFAQILGYDEPADLVGHDVRRLYPAGGDREAYLERLRERGRLVNEELRLERRDGTEIWVLENSALTEDPETGRIVNEGTLVDITQRRRAERERRLLSTAVETMTTGVLITGPNLDPPGPEIRYVNDAITEITGYGREELIGETPRIFQGPATDRAELDRLRDRLGAGEAFEGETVNYRKDGTPYHLRWRVTPLRDEAGEITHFVSVQEDVTDQRRTERRLRESEEQFRQMAESIEEVFWLRRAEGEELLYVSPAYEEIWGRPVEGLHERPEAWLEAVHPDDQPRVREAVFRGAERVFEVEYRIVRPDGEVRWIHDQGFPVEQPEEDSDRVAGVARDVTDRKRLEEQLRYDALHDPLTGLANRALLQDRLEHGLARARRHGEPLGLLMLDVDHFKRVNDRLGHVAGDRVLTELARRLDRVTREQDTVARWGGDEFVVLLAGLAGPGEVEEVRDRIREAIRPPVEVDGEPVYVDLTVGAVVHSDEDHRWAVQTRDPEELIRFGSLALHWAKEEAPGGFSLFDPTEEVEGTARIRRERDLRDALEEGRIVPHYQSVVRLDDRTPVGVEVLARWEHPERGLLGPAEFVPLAEELGLIGRLQEVVIRRACRELTDAASSDGASGPAQVRFNVSGRQFREPNLVRNLRDAVEETGCRPDRVVLEVTETSLMQVPATVDELRRAGFRISIDDFGTGYSTFVYLRDLEVDELKVDMTFVQGIAESPSDAALVETMLTLGRRLGLDVVAEGVETEAQLRELRSLGCELGQGYLFERPGPLGRPSEDEGAAGG